MSIFSRFKKYYVDYCGKKDAFSCAKDFYHAGEKVTIYYPHVATDTDYYFNVDSEQFTCDFSNEKGYILSFIMPARSIKISVMQKVLSEQPIKLSLNEFDEKRVRLITVHDEVFEGICTYSNDEYCEHEYGRKEDCLEILSFVFFNSDIKSVCEISEFSLPFDYLEEQIIKDGEDSIADVFDSEENIHISRMLSCIKHHILQNDVEVLPSFYTLKSLLCALPNDEMINRQKDELINMINNRLTLE